MVKSHSITAHSLKTKSFFKKTIMVRKGCNLKIKIHIVGVN
jgi:hypothetical protein